jgi:hypothetical protein
MTNAIGRGNVRVNLCLPEEVKNVLAREATSDSRSLANLIWAAAMEQFRKVKPTLAAEIQAAHEEHLRVIRSSACLLIGLLSIAASMFGGVDMRRASTRVRPVTRNVRRIEA